MRDRYEVLPTPAGTGRRLPWRLTRNGVVMAHADRQQELVDLGGRFARLRLLLCGKVAELVIKRPDGRVRDSRTYGADPVRTKG